MTLEVVPAALYSMRNVKPILADGSSSILHKTLETNLENKAIYIATPLIVYIKQGKQIIRDHDAMAHVVEENHLIFLSKGVYTVSDYVTGSDIFEAVLLFCDDKLIAKYLSRAAGTGHSHTDSLQNNAHGTYILHANQQIQRYIDSLNYVYKDAEGSDALLELKLLELLHLIAIQDKSFRFLRELSSGGSRKRRPITDFMEQYYSHKLKIEDYALLTGRSVSTFIRDFRRSYNTTPNRWIIEKKVDIAHQLLTAKNYSVTDAAAEVGYENTSHFIKVYKQRYGVTPKKAKAFAAEL
ncbi:AraC-type DNA-binding domain and AraC-containing protein [Chromobacterium violaceum]|uniref:helix-turn-helix transcriptional regulator n=1 Tax=Chromobacterium violaceum TaxID=536 RepID=UPI003CF9033A